MGRVEVCGRCGGRDGEVWRERWRSVVGGVEEYGGRGGGVWEGWRCMGRVEVCEKAEGVWELWRCVGGVWWEGWRSVVGEVECGGKGGGVWWEGWRCVGMSEVCGRSGGVGECGGRGKLCGGRGGGV